MDHHFMTLAFEEATKSTEPLQCGVVIVRHNEILAQAHNAQRARCDASAHAEILSLHLAGKKIQNKNLDGCVAYCTHEPCVMCLSALVYAKIQKIVYAIPLSAVSPTNKRIDIPFDLFLSKSPHKIEVFHYENYR